MDRDKQDGRHYGRHGRRGDGADDREPLLLQHGIHNDVHAPEQLVDNAADVDFDRASHQLVSGLLITLSKITQYVEQ